jgi:hypothetical protein
MAGRMGRLAEPGPDGSEDCIADGGTHNGRRRLAEADGNLFAIRVLYSSMYPAGRSSEQMHRKTLLPRHHCQEF